MLNEITMVSNGVKIQKQVAMDYKVLLEHSYRQKILSRTSFRTDNIQDEIQT
jgi:hypothetical protein